MRPKNNRHPASDRVQIIDMEGRSDGKELQRKAKKKRKDEGVLSIEHFGTLEPVQRSQEEAEPRFKTWK